MKPALLVELHGHEQEGYVGINTNKRRNLKRRPYTARTNTKKYWEKALPSAPLKPIVLTRKRKRVAVIDTPLSAADKDIIREVQYFETQAQNAPDDYVAEQFHEEAEKAKDRLSPTAQKVVDKLQMVEPTYTDEFFNPATPPSKLKTKRREALSMDILSPTAQKVVKKVQTNLHSYLTSPAPTKEARREAKRKFLEDYALEESRLKALNSPIPKFINIPAPKAKSPKAKSPPKSSSAKYSPERDHQNKEMRKDEKLALEYLPLPTKERNAKAKSNLDVKSKERVFELIKELERKRAPALAEEFYPLLEKDRKRKYKNYSPYQIARIKELVDLEERKAKKAKLGNKAPSVKKTKKGNKAPVVKKAPEKGKMTTSFGALTKEGKKAYFDALSF